MFTLENFLVIVTSYLIGTIPTAYLIVKLFAKKDVLVEGTGNVGAMNSYDVTGKRYVGFLVFLLDALKGFAAVYLAQYLFGNKFIYSSLATIWVVLGHNYNAFLSFKGGRGLASSVGALSAISPFAVALWGLMWITGYFVIKKDVHIANTVALAGTPILVFSAPNEVINLTSTMGYFKAIDYKILLLVLCGIILIRHIKPMLEKFRKKEEI